MRPENRQATKQILMLAEMVIGDAYGRGFDNRTAHYIFVRNKTEEYVCHTGKGKHIGHYTARTRGALAVAELMIHGRPWTKTVICDALVKTYHKDQRSGYNEDMASALGGSKDGTQFRTNIVPIQEDAEVLLRSVPLGILPVWNDVVHSVQYMAKTTHDLEEAVAASIAAAAMIYYCAYQLGDIPGIIPFVRHLTPAHEFVIPWTWPTTERTTTAIAAALTAFSRNTSMKELLWHCVHLNGYPSYPAAIALAAASLHPDYQKDLPNALFDHLERGPFGANYVARLDEQFMKIIPTELALV